MKISNLALVAAMAFTGITASNASLTAEQSDVMDRTSNATLAAVLTELPPTVGGDLGTILPKVAALGGTDAAYDLAQADAAAARPAGVGPVAGDFVVTGGTAPAAFLVATPASGAGGADDTFEVFRNQLIIMYRRLTNGITAVGATGVGALNDGDDTTLGLALATAEFAAQDALIGGGHVTTEANVTLPQIAQVLFAIRLKD